MTALDDQHNAQLDDSYSTYEDMCDRQKEIEAFHAEMVAAFGPYIWFDEYRAWCRDHSMPLYLTAPGNL